MEIACLIIGWILVFFGFLGCFVEKIPGPLMAFIGLLIFVWGTSVSCEWWVLLLVGIMVIASKILSKKLLPKIGQLVAEYGKGGSWGAMVGSLIGLITTLVVGNTPVSTAIMIIVLIVSFIVLPYVFALLFEFIAKKSFPLAAQAAGGALVAFLAGTMLKLGVCAYAVYAVIAN